jgi:hypothetical protein
MDYIIVSALLAGTCRVLHVGVCDGHFSQPQLILMLFLFVAVLLFWVAGIAEAGALMAGMASCVGEDETLQGTRTCDSQDAS